MATSGRTQQSTKCLLLTPFSWLCWIFLLFGGGGGGGGGFLSLIEWKSWRTSRRKRAEENTWDDRDSWPWGHKRETLQNWDGGMCLGCTLLGRIGGVHNNMLKEWITFGGGFRFGNFFET